MVGVPGRSKGCHTCRQRRIRCSLQKPQCSQCLKSNRICPGYQRERIFIQSLAPPKNGRRTSEKSLPSETITDPPGSVGSFDALLSSKGSEHSRSASVQFNPSPLAPGNNELSQSALRQQLFDAFISCHIPVGQLGPMEEKSWFMLVPDLPTPTRALEISTLAICTAKLGRVNDDPVLVRESLKLYTHGLHELQKALWDPALMYRDETLGACMALAMYELVECPAETKYGYVSHHNGCARLVQLRGVEAHTSGLGHQLFLAFRIQGILQALERHRPTYLSNPDWTKLPWKNSTKEPFDLLLDFLSLAPDVLRKADEFEDLTSNSLLLAALRIVDRCWELDAGLGQFYEHLERNALGPLYWPEFSTEPSSTSENQPGTVFPVAFHFLNLKMATTLMFYWATLTMLWSGLSRLYYLISTIQLDGAITNGSDDGYSSSHSFEEWSPNHLCSLKDQVGSLYFDLRKLPPLGHRADFASTARNVCQSVEYCMKDEMLGLGPSAVIAPLSIVADTLKEHPGYEREVLWAKAALERVHRRGMRFLKFFDRL